MKKIYGRLLVFFLGIPLVLALCTLRFCHYLVLQLAAGVSSAIGSIELYEIFSKKYRLLSKPIVTTLSILLPAGTYVFLLINLPPHYIDLLFLESVFLLFVWAVFRLRNFENANEAISLSALIIFYCGYLMSFLSRIAGSENATAYLITFFCMIFFCDSCAWAFGMLFGKKNRGIVKASPNKSIAGFAGGVLGTLCIAFLARSIFAGVFHASVLKTVFFALLISFSAIIGDLVESVFKRSANVKDSGVLMPGRGGILDSIDSILFSAPVFYFALHFFYGLPLA